MIGQILIYVAFGLSVISGIFYLIAKDKPGLLKLGRFAYYGVTATMLAISMYLLSNILSHNFQMTYVWEYSSTTLPLNLLISTFYAGQQGSFLLWGLTLTLIGFFLIPYLKERNYEYITMGIFVLVIAFILLILIFKSPFEFVWETYADQNVEVGFTPKEGRGLNPILQNYWINIHPPILFLGYSAMTIPYIFAIAGLLKKDYRKWIRLALPWTLFASAILGLGLMLGGLWAYETLGWGGFWAWDPVENSSLIPWLTAVTLVHTMYIHQKTGGLIKTNFVLAFLTFLFVLYATFLTRSGVLGDT
ncbi:MAG: cytochrome c biogenesis protein CcsA, partial [Candidatus Kapaibacterium sp.]